tara:strand:+ start:4171 stop:5748 length:1578 start_codon:yes stop_codon:yes gene_type:complete
MSEFNNPSLLIKDLNFSSEAREKIVSGVEKLAKAVKSTLGASGKCVIYEDALGKPVITKDGVTVAESVVLYDPVENMGATLIKEAAQNTVREAGDGTTTATVLAESLIQYIYKTTSNKNVREIKAGIYSGLEKIYKYLENISIAVEGDMLKSVGSISCNNDAVLGEIIATAYEKVGKDGVVLMEESETNETYVNVVEGVQLNTCGITSAHFITDTDKGVCELEDPLVLVSASEIPSTRKIQSILEYVIKNKRSLLIVSKVSQQVQSALYMNKMKGNISVNIIDPPGFGPTRPDTIQDLALLVNAKVYNESLGDDLDLMTPEELGEVSTSITYSDKTVLTLNSEEKTKELKDRVKLVKNKIAKEKNGFIKKKLEERLAMLCGSVAIMKVGADSKVELKEKKDRVEDAIHATKAALKEGIVPGGGIALLNASINLKAENDGEKILFEAIKSPFATIMDNANLEIKDIYKEGFGVDVTTGKEVDMVKTGIIDPVLVTKSALKNAISVATTVVSAECVISNMRSDESSK